MKAFLLGMKELALGCARRFLSVCLLLASLVTPLQAVDFPLEKGNYWIYRGETKYLVKQPGSGKNVSKTEVLTWKMEVMDTVTRGSLFVALIKGAPFDLSWYEPGKSRGNYLILRDGPSVYYLFSGQTARDVWAKIKDASQPLADLKENGEIFLDLPLVEGKAFGGEPDNRTQGRYCWVVQGERAFNPKRFPAAGKLDNPRDFTLVYRTNPDHQILDFVPGIGIVGYQYVHHGTLSETDLGLIKFGTAQ